MTLDSHRLRLPNALGVSALGGIGVALASGSAPVVQTQAPTAIAGASALLQGTVNPRSRPTTYWFEVGTTLAYGTTTTSASAGKGDKPVAVTSTIAGLQPATTYHARVVASNDRGVTQGEDVTFTTLGGLRPRPGAGMTPGAAARHRARARTSAPRPR
jgi:hypothetical protein